MENWDKVEDYLDVAEAIAWDKCHKIYVLLDEGRVSQMAEYGYDPLIRLADVSRDEASAIVRQWYEDSCSLKFITAIRTNEYGTSDFDDLIRQFAWDE